MNWDISNLFLSIKRIVFLISVSIIASPVVFLLLSFFTPITYEFSSKYSLNIAFTTLHFILWVTFFSVIIGTTLAYLLSTFIFPGSKVFSILLFLPFCLPPYVMAFTQLGFWDGYLGRNSTLEAAFIMSLCLYPYVFIFTKAAFTSQGKRLIEVAQSFQWSPFKCFLKVSLPLAWPWITGASLFVIMESLSDFGLVSILNVNTVSVSIYKAWFSYFSIETALRIAQITIFIVLCLLYLEHKIREKRRFYQMNFIKNEKILLNGTRSLLAFIFCLSIFSISFIIPCFQLVYWNLDTFNFSLVLSLIPEITNTIIIASILSVVALMFALLVLLTLRFETQYKKMFNGLLSFASIGYAIPGAVLAVLSYSVLHNFRFLNQSVSLVIIGLLTRFFMVGLNPIKNGLNRLSGSIDNAARSLGCTSFQLSYKVLLPNISVACLVAVLFLFVETVKEMPITLMTRPFGWDTLSVKVFEFTSEGEWNLASIPALLITCISLLPVYFISKKVV